MNRANSQKNYAQAAAQQKNNKASHTNNPPHHNQQHHHQQVSQTLGSPTSSNFSSSANGKSINNPQTKPQTQHNSTMGNGNTGRSAPIKQQQKNSVTLPTNGQPWETAPTSLVFGSIKNTSNAQISSLPSSASQTLTSGGGLPSTLPTKGVMTFGSLPTNTTTTPNTQATQATQVIPTTVGTSGPGVNNIINNNNNNNSNGISKSISARANEIPRTHSAPPQFQDSNRNVGQSGHTSNVVPARNLHQQQSAAVPHQQTSTSVSNSPLNNRKDSVSSTVSSNDGQQPFHPHHSPHHPPNQHGHPPHYRQHTQHHSAHKPMQTSMYGTPRPRDNKPHPSPHLNPAQQPIPAQQSAMPIPMFTMYNRYYMDYSYPVAHNPMYMPPPFVPQRPPQISQPLPPVNNVPFQKQTTNKAIEIIDPSRGAPIQISNINNSSLRQQQNYNKREETLSTVSDKKTKESDKEKPNSEDKGVSKAVPIIDPAEQERKERERKEREEREEQERLAKEKEERERKEREEQERLAKEKEERERKEREEQERIAKEKEERERKEREEQERIAKEKKEKEERERKEREERERKEREEKERIEREERERKEREEREERERKEREEKERIEREERERKEREERERKEREEQERIAKEKEEQERKEREEQERIAKEKEERERKEREEREERERKEREEKERIEKEERERKEKEEKEERERLEAEERERKEAEKRAQEEKALEDEIERKKKQEDESVKAKTTTEEEAEKKKKAETLDKKEEKKRPGPLDLSRTTSAPAIPSAPLSALGSARMLDNLNSIQYPQGIKSPNPELNSNAEPGKFKYDRSFLMQFMTVCKEKPENLPALEAIGMEEPKDDKKRANTRASSGSSRSLHKGSPNQSQFAQMGEFKFTSSLKTSEERFAASQMRNGISSTPGIFGRTPLGRTGSGSTLLPTMSSANPPSPGRPPSSGRKDSRRSGKGAHQMQPNVGQEHVAPLERSENRWVPQILTSKSNDDTIFESVQRKVKALLNKLTLEKFDSISDQIVEFANKSRDERDGRILREVIRLIFEKSCDESNFCAMYAQLCRKMMERVDPEIVDENVKNTEGKFVQGGTLFRKYLLNRCQEEFEKGWKVNIPVPSNEKGEPDLMSDEYYAAARAKRQGLGLIRFIGELFKLHMLTERIMHECIKKLLIFQGTPEEEEMESLCKLMNTVGEQLDHVKPQSAHEQMKSTQLDHAKAKKYMESYFERMEEISKLPNLSSRIKFMLMDVIDLRNNAWKPRRDVNAPKTIAEIHEDAAKQKEEAEFMRRTTSSGGRGMPKITEQMSRSGSNRQHRSDKGMAPSSDGWSTVGGGSSQRNKEKVGDLTKFGSVSRSKIVNLAPGGILAGLSGGAKGWSKSDNKDRDDKSTGLSRANSATNIYSVLNSDSSEGRKSSESISSDTQKPSPPTERKKLILAPRTKGLPPDEPKLPTKSTSESATSSQTTEELDTKMINSINNMVEEFFSIWDNREVNTCLKEDIPIEYHSKAIETFANTVIEKKQKDVDNVMKLFKEIVSSRTCDSDAFKDGFKATLEFLMDIGADAPMAYSFTGQLLFSAGLDFRDITKLLKPFDDDWANEKIVKGYASALKNDVDEQKFVQKINDFDLKSLFQKKSKDDINKYIEDLGGSSKK